MSKVIPANIFFEKTESGDMVIIEYYPPLKQSKRINLTIEEWNKLIKE